MTSPSPFPRRMGLRLLAALLLLGLTLSLRWGWDQIQPRSQPSPPPAAREPGAAEMVARYQARLKANPDDTDAYALLGRALLQQVRENGDSSLYGRAQMALDEALARAPTHTDALVGKGLLALALHQFNEALTWGERARAANPFRAEALGIEVDGYVELGRYPEAIAAAQEMVDMQPGVGSYTRVAYLRELHGDVDGAIEAMDAAAGAAVPGTEAYLWSGVQLGHLYFHSGRWEEAEGIYRGVLAHSPDYVHGLAALARVSAARGDSAQAIRRYEEVLDRLPLPEYAKQLAELYDVVGEPRRAREQRELVRSIQQLERSAGMETDLEMALFEADYGDDPAAAVALARAAYERRPSIYAADGLAWALYRAGDPAAARAYSDESLRLGTRDGLLHFHAGMIALGVGDVESGRRHLEEALAINPAFSIRYAPEARTVLAEMGGQ